MRRRQLWTCAAAYLAIGIALLTAMPNSTFGQAIRKNESRIAGFFMPKEPHARANVIKVMKAMHLNVAWGEAPNTYFCHFCPNDCPTGTEGVDWYYCGG